jgi:hypothetical protein
MNATTKEVDLIIHTTCGLAFEVVDAKDDRSISGRVNWCTDEEMEEDEEIEERGWEHFRKKIAAQGWTIREEVWS